MTNGPLSQRAADKGMDNMPGMNHGDMPGMAMPKLPENAETVPLFPCRMPSWKAK